MMKKSGIMQQTELLNNAQGYHIRLGEESINGQRNTQTKIGRQDALLEMKQSKSQYAITQSQKEEEYTFNRDNYIKEPLEFNRENFEAINLINANIKDHQKYGKKILQKTSLEQRQASNSRKKPHPLPYKSYQWFQFYLEIPQDYVDQQLNQSQFEKNLKCRQDYEGAVENEFGTVYHILFLKKCKIEEHLYKLFKQQVQKGYFCTKQTGQDGLKILKNTKEVLYQIRIRLKSRLIGSLMKFKEENVNLIVFEKMADNKANVQSVKNDINKFKRLMDLKKSIYESIKLGDNLKK